MLHLLGREGPAGPGADHNDVRATKGFHTSARSGRYVGLVIAGIAAGGALLLWFAVSARYPLSFRSPKSKSLFGRVARHLRQPGAWPHHLDRAVGLGLTFAAAAALVERVVMDRSRRSTDAEAKLLAPRLVMAEPVASSADRSR